MRPLLHPMLINGRTGDPALYVETLFEKRAILFDLGDITSLSPRKIRRLEHVFVSHAHIDHFYGFDRLLRVLVGRDKQIHLYGPNGFINHVHHKLQAYLWNLVDREPGDLTFVVTEIDPSHSTQTARFRLKTAFAAEVMGTGRIDEGIVVKDPTFRVSTAALEHHTPCLGFAIEEPAHFSSQNWGFRSGHGWATLSVRSLRANRMIFRSGSAPPRRARTIMTCRSESFVTY